MPYRPLATYFLLLFYLPLTAYWLFTAWLAWHNPAINDWFSFRLFGILFLLFLAPMFIVLLIGIVFHKRPAIHAIIKSACLFFDRRAARIAMSALLLLPLAWSSIRFQNQPKIVPPKLLVLGLDGAFWPMLHRLDQEKKIPAISRLMQLGAYGELMSIEPSRSPLLWTTIATGLTPEEHGVSGFFSTRGDLKAPRVWDIAQAKGMDVGLFSWIVTWPPEPTFSFCIPSWMARNPETYPLDMHCIQEIQLGQSIQGGKVDPASALWKNAARGAGFRGLEQMALFYCRDRFKRADKERLKDKMFSEIRLQTDMFLSLLRKNAPQVATFTLYGSDKLAHRFWHHAYPEQFNEGEVYPDRRFQTVLEEYYIQADRAFGRILREMDEDTTVMLLSDHGMKADQALPRQYFLDIHELLSLLGVAPFFQHQTIQRRFRLTPTIDDPTLLDEIQAKLEAIEMDGPVFTVEQIDGGLEFRAAFSLSWNPDSPIRENETILIDGKPYPTSQLFFARTFSGAHDPKGVLIMKGPNISPHSRIGDADLFDIAPTMLHILGLPATREMKGRVLEKAFRPEWMEKNPVELIDQYDVELYDADHNSSDHSLLERLRSVGYVE